MTAARAPAALHLFLGWFLPTTLLAVNMWKARAFTIDDAYISFRYARNFADGLGLVYNPGERIEGYTNFLWTILLGAGLTAGIEPEILAKVLGGIAACGALGATYVLSGRVHAYAAVPSLATWLMATSIVQAGYAVFGLETSLFTCLVLWGLVSFLNERDTAGAIPWSGVLFGIAGLTRPEAPMYLGIPMLLLGRELLARQNLLRAGVFIAIVGTHLLWRHSYYGEWLPNTLAAKTGDLTQQLALGEQYLRAYARHTWPVFALAGLGFLVTTPGLIRRHPAATLRARAGGDFTVRVMVALGAGVAGYVALVGGDWMPYFRFLAPFEPFYFVFACVGARTVLDGLIDWNAGGHAAWTSRSQMGLGAVSIIALTALGAFRVERLDDARQRVVGIEKAFWDSAAGVSGDWLAARQRPGVVALGDIGYVGYVTNYPVLDLLGLVDPVISRLPGGYTQKTGSGYFARVFDVMPTYFVLVGTRTCDVLAFEAQDIFRRDERFRRSYVLAATIPHSKRGVWCIFERRGSASTGPGAG